MTTLTAASRPRLRPGTRLTYDRTRDTLVLLFPEGVLVPNQTANDILARCDGATSVSGIAEALTERYHGVEVDDVLALVEELVSRRLVEVVDA
jgi:pyrroloquinoline quinone biosynthesis protein D